MTLPQLLIPDWPAPRTVRAVFTQRQGGVSAPPFDCFNLGAHVGDDAADVAANRHLLELAVGAPVPFLNQVHGTRVVQLTVANTPVAPPPEADACWTATSGLVCSVMVADCLPVLFCTTDGSLVGAAHAGWRGLCDGVLEATVGAMREAWNGRAEDRVSSNAAAESFHLLAWLGPAIGPRAFEVGAEVRQAFLVRANDAAETECIARQFTAQTNGKFIANLSGLARLRLQRAGVSAIYGNDGTDAWCTVKQEPLYFSHRRDTRRLGASGRMAGCVWMG